MKKSYSLFSGSARVFTQGSINKETQSDFVSTKVLPGIKKAVYCCLVLFSMQTFANNKSSLAFQDCAPAPLVAGASNITNSSAIINWVGVPVTAPTYTLEVYTDAGFTALFNTYTAINGTSYSVTGLADETEYFFRVKVDNATCGDYGMGSFMAQLNYTPLEVTGYTADVIANGTGPASGSTNLSVDNSTSAGANFAYLCIDYKPTGASPSLTYGLPENRSLTSSTNSDLKYILQDYSGSNSLRLSAQNDFGVLSLTEPVSLSEVYLAVASGDGSSTISVEVQFTDATVQEAVTGIEVINWDSPATTASPAIITNIGRVKRTTGAASSGNFKVFQLMIPVTLENQGKLVSGVKVTKTATGTESKIPNIFAVSGKLVSTCPSVSVVSADALSQTSATFGWTLGSEGQGTEDITYTLEVYTDAGYTTPVTGSPFTNLTGTSQEVAGLSLDTQYFYRVKANNGVCDSDYIEDDFTLAYCVPTSNNGVSYYITNFSTTAGYTNITNATSSGSYNNYVAMAVSKPAGTTFNYSITKTSGYAQGAVYVDWNQDLDFDDEGEVIATFNGAWNAPTVVTGTITIPAGAALGDYRMRVRTAYYFNTTMSACDNLSYGEAEDYTISVVEQPEDCETPETPGLVLSDVTASSITGTVTLNTTAPTGYVLIRSTSATMETPAAGTSFSVGNEYEGGYVLAVGAAVEDFTNYLAANTHYYYYLFAYNEGGLDCFGPIYGTPAVADATTCAIATVAASASNITGASANLNWSSVVGVGGNEATYTVEVYNDAVLEDLMGTYTTSDISYLLTNLTNGNTYFYRVKAEAGECDDDSWSLVSSFTAQNSYTPIDVTGYNADVIANGTGIANVSTTNAVDAVSNSYIALNYEPTSGNVTTVGLPLNRTLTSGSTPALKFLLQDYGGNNSLRLPAQNQSGSLTLTQPVKASEIFLAVTSGSGTSVINTEIMFEDGTSQIAAGISVSDWYNAGTGSQPALVSNIGRANRANLVGSVDPGNSKIFYITLAINLDNQSKLISGIEITKTSAGAEEPVPNIFAISANVIDCPTLNGLVAEATTDGAVITFGAAGTVEDPAYTVEVYTDEEMTMPVTGSPFAVTESTLTLTGLDALTTYYYDAVATTTACTSNMEGTFTTSCLAPAAPTTTALALCSGATVADLSAEGVDGATFNWYASVDATETLSEETMIEAGSYFVSQTTGGCESERAEVAVTINTTAVPTADAQTVCNGTAVSELTATGVEGATFNWYATAEATEALDGEAMLETGSYFVSQTVEGCESERTEVAVTVNTTAVPTADAQTFCNGATVTELTATGVEGIIFNWYASAGATETLSGEAMLETGSYFVSQTVEGCESERAEVAVTVNTTAVPTADAQTVCNGTAVSELTATGVEGATFNWYATAEATEALDGEAMLETGSYFVSQTVEGCESERTEVAVTVNTTAVPTADAQTFCSGATAAELTATGVEGAAFNWYTSAGATETLDGEAMLETGSYFVSQTVEGCESERTEVNVTVNATPDTPEGDAIQEFDTGDTVATLTVSVDESAVVNWYVMNDDEELVSVDATTVLVDGETYYVTQTLGNCESETLAITVNEILNTVVFETSSLKVYPNPANAIITVTNNTAIESIEIANLLGQKVLSKRANTESTQVDVSGLAAGTYILSVQSQNGAITSVKIVKQ